MASFGTFSDLNIWNLEFKHALAVKTSFFARLVPVGLMYHDRVANFFHNFFQNFIFFKFCHQFCWIFWPWATLNGYDWHETWRKVFSEYRVGNPAQIMKKNFFFYFWHNFLTNHIEIWNVCMSWIWESIAEQWNNV